MAILPATPHSAAAQAWLERLRLLALQEPHRLLAHVDVRYGGDLSGGQRLAAQAQAILSRHGLPPLAFWSFATPVSELKLALHAGIEQLEVLEAEEQEPLEEAECAFQLTQRLPEELDALT